MQFKIIMGSVLLLLLLIVTTDNTDLEKAGSKSPYQTVLRNAGNIAGVVDTGRAEHPKIKVLNLGTFHMGLTTDANSTEFDEHDKENQKKVHEIANLLSAFEPTVLVVEAIPEYNDELQSQYATYFDKPEMVFEKPNEIQLLAFELGRLSGAKRIYGIDHKMEYNYLIAKEIENSIDPEFIDRFYKDPLHFYPTVNVDEDTLSLLDKLKVINHDRYLDFLMTINADIMALVGTERGFEGADEATKFYQRNLRMYANLNRIRFNIEDRVFILLGASHTAFFRDFLSRSPKYEMVNTFEYLGK